MTTSFSLQIQWDELLTIENQRKPVVDVSCYVHLQERLAKGPRGDFPPADYSFSPSCFSILVCRPVLFLLMVLFDITSNRGELELTTAFPAVGTVLLVTLKDGVIECLMQSSS